MFVFPYVLMFHGPKGQDFGLPRSANGKVVRISLDCFDLAMERIRCLIATAIGATDRSVSLGSDVLVSPVLQSAYVLVATRPLHAECCIDPALRGVSPLGMKGCL